MKCSPLIAKLLVSTLLAVAARFTAADAADLAELPVNRWTTLCAGDAMVRVHPRMLWLPEEKRGFMWLNLNYHARAISFEDHAQSRFFSPVDGAWQSKPASFAPDDRISPAVVGHACVYLPGLKKVLLLLPHDRYSRGTKAMSWLFDPATDSWEPVGDAGSMADDPTQFAAAASSAGERVPLWGTLVYDALNEEAVAIGGGATWGRVGRAKQKVAVGDWIFAEVSQRIRRLTPDDQGRITEARKWYPAHCGTWIFSERTLKWRPIGQPLGEQPCGRILPAAAYDGSTGTIVLFGGDDYVKCLRDTWIYDCRRRKWRAVRPEPSPPARAFAGMTATAGNGVILLAGGYGPGWRPRRDVWIYKTGKKEWSRLAVDLPEPAACCSAEYDPASRAVLVSSSDSAKRSTTARVCALRFDLSSVPRVAPAETDVKSEYHSKMAADWYVPLPGEWHDEKDKGPDAKTGRRELAALPVNTWVHRDAPMKPRGRQWGSYTYDARTHTAYAWGGGHYGYVGNEVNEYDVLTGRWRSQIDPTAYKPRWWHGAGGGGGTAGVGFQGWRLMGVHARKSYAVDVLSYSLLTLHGDVYSLKHHMFVGNIGRCPGGYGLSQQECFLNTPHGLYAFGRSRRFGPVMHRADVKHGRWELVAKGGDPEYDESSHVCYDSRRDRMVYVNSKTARVWTFDFETKTWLEQTPSGGKPERALGDSCYIPELDAVFMIFAGRRGGLETNYFYKLDERKWYTSPYRGKALFSKITGRDASPFFDPELNLIVRVAHENRAGWIDVLVMRLDGASLDLSPM